VKYVGPRVKPWLFLFPAIILGAAIWDARRSEVASVDVFFAGAGGLLLGVFLMVRVWADSMDLLADAATDLAKSATGKASPTNARGGTSHE
jgi:hypothetical protein